MCGRYVSSTNDQALFDLFEVRERIGEPAPPSWNVAPTDPVRVILDDPRAEGPAVRVLREVRWGLVPSWAKDVKVGARMINARVESVTEKPSFRSAAARRRCVVPADGYYEWQRDGGGKVPYYLHAPDESPLAFAGLYERWRDPAIPDDDPARWVWTCTIITTRAADTVGHIHDRTPLILPRSMVDDWLDPGTTAKAEVQRLLDAVPEPHLVPRRVGAAVGSVRNDGPQLVAPAG
ncbi:SOS response-associated peptidase [Allonocardiopsis opalescens]|uniref:Abasic site processing protein n=1 Tax=Allonocardiopsis opalescens TaxID=1144618 RepID=A0A2T0Q0C7_9ACTN|nr:SOS response-associated peptidase [Allonocardiopsis opalescens]PRX97252.1 putative SOS response-associated peptidase YedK [Allonocardiopsis opalescens]